MVRLAGMSSRRRLGRIPGRLADSAEASGFADGQLLAGLDDGLLARDAVRELLRWREGAVAALTDPVSEFGLISARTNKSFTKLNVRKGSALIRLFSDRIR